MKNTILILLVLILSVSCSDKTDDKLLEEDKKQLQEDLDSYKVAHYKFYKILIKSLANADTSSVSDEVKIFQSEFSEVSRKLMQYNIGNPDSLSLTDYIAIYQSYRKMKGLIRETNEDIFPTLTDVISTIYKDSNTLKLEYLKGEEKEIIQNVEHTILSVVAILSRDLGGEISLYECSKTKPELLPDSELKTLLRYFRGFLFFEKDLLYLSENEISGNIDWLNENKDVDLPLTKAVFQWGRFNNQQTHIAFHSINHLFRGFDRLMMEREIDEQRAMDDFKIFLEDAQNIGIDNELIWSIETYLNLKNEEPEKAVASLTKLKTSVLLSSKEKERIDESIEYLKNRESGKVLNGLYDKYFLSKIATTYMFEVLSQIDWEKVLKENDVRYAEEMIKGIDNLKNFVRNFQKYTSGEHLKVAGERIQETGKDLWNMSKSLLE